MKACQICGRLFSEDDLEECDRCKREICSDCREEGFQGFNSWDGDVDYFITCADCAGWESPAVKKDGK